MPKKILIGSGLIVALIIISIICFMPKEEEMAEANDIERLEEPVVTNEDHLVKVDIKGAIKKPGVYEVSDTYRVNDVISLAGGLNKEANTNYINLSAKVADEMVIWIYTNKEIEEFKVKESSSMYMIEECNCPVVDNTTCLNNNNENNSSLININTATLEELMTLEGIGEAKAQNIINYRNNNGKFKTKEELMNVNGIGSSAYDKIKDHITV